MIQALDSIHNRCMEGYAAFVCQQYLPGIADAYARQQYSEEMLQFPCVVCTPEGEMEEDADATSWETVWVWYPVRVYIAHRIEAGNEEMRAVVLGWRSVLLHETRKLASLEFVPECKDVRIKYGAVIDPKLPQYQTVLGAFTIQCLCGYIKPAQENRISEVGIP